MAMKLPNRDFFEENEELRAYFCSAPREKKLHFHEFWELTYVYEGTGKCEWAEREGTADGFREDELVRAGCFLLIKPEQQHSLTSLPQKEGAPARACCCIFTQAYFEQLSKELIRSEGLSVCVLYDMLFDRKPFCIRLTDDNAQNIRHLMWLVAHEYNHFTVGSETVMRSAMLSLLISIIRLYDYQRNHSSLTVTRNDEIDNLIKYMRSNFGYKLTLDFLAAHMHLSREYLSRYFKKHTGKTISEFLLEIRISRAKEMLRNSSHSVSDIAAYCGYPSVSNFQKAFKKVTGVSPGAYRNSKHKP